MPTASFIVLVWTGVAAVAVDLEPRGQLRVIVRSEGQPVIGASVVAGERRAETGADGVAQLDELVYALRSAISAKWPGRNEHGTPVAWRMDRART